MVLLPFFNAVSEGRAPALTLPAAAIYNTGANQLGPLQQLAACLRERLRRTADADLSPAATRASASTSRRSGRSAMSPIPPSRCRICRAR